MQARYADTLTAELAELLGYSIHQVYAKAKRMRLYKSKEFMATDQRVRLRPGTLIGVSGRFPKGNVPVNKGVRSPGYAPGRMSETQFKPGRRPRIPIGGHRVDPEGFLMRRVTDTGYNDWKFEHRCLWQEANGPIPKGHKLCFKDGDRRNVSLDNLVLLTDAEVMRRNTIHNLPPELVEVIRITGKINQITRRREREEQNVRSAQPSI